MQTETLPSGTILHGRYRVERALGSGGFGHVYLSTDLQTNTPYAVKEYLVTGANGKAQLEHEAQVLSHLHHPNLPAYLTAFDERGHYYVVLGYIEGNDLTDYIRVVRQKNEAIPIARLMEWILSICDAVAFLHSQQPPIIHRDIKPDNIRITPNGTATLVDLGNAKTAADGARTLFFIRHQGTPGYAPLEQYPGGTGTDERSDIYALGGTLYFALTAHEPPSVSARNQSLQQKQPDLPSLQERLAQNPPDMPQEQRQFRLGVTKPAKPAPRHSRHLAQLGTLPPEILRKLDAIIQRAMAMKPKDRYQTVTDFTHDLMTVLQALPATTVPPMANGRPVDPHSTQPDLPMLYEAIQNAQDAASRQTTPVPPVSTNPPQTPAPMFGRCPRCGLEQTRIAPYCPRCGNPLNNPPNSPRSQAQVGPAQAVQNTPQTPVKPDVSEAATLLIRPRPTPQEPVEGTPRPNSASPVQAAQSADALPTSRSAPTTYQQMQHAQSAATAQTQDTPPKMSARTAQDVSPKAPIRSSQANVKPFIPSATLPPATNQTQPPAAAEPPDAPASASPHSEQGRVKKLFISLAIVIAALIIIALLLLVFLRSGHGGHHVRISGQMLSHLLDKSQSFAHNFREIR